MSSLKATIAVMGATGAQGGAVAEALLAAGKFKVKAITRSPNSQKAQALTAKGADVVQGDLSDESSLVQAFRGADSVFLLTDFWQGCGAKANVELQQSQNAARAANQAGVQFLVYSALEDPRPVLRGTKELPGHPGSHVMHYESKQQVTDYLATSPVPNTSVLTGCYYENFLTLLPMVPQKDGSYAWPTHAGPDAPIAWMALADFGKAVVAILEDKETYIGKRASCTSAWASPNDMVQAISTATSKKYLVQPVTYDQAFNASFPGAADLANMWTYFTNHSDYMRSLRTLEPIKGMPPAQWADTAKDGLLARFNSIAAS